MVPRDISMICMSLVTLVPVVLSLNCTGKQDGVYDQGCRSYTKCDNGTAVVMFCITRTAYNRDTFTCDDAFNVPPPCGTYRECSALDDGTYPDIDMMCTSYYTCNRGQFFGHSLCPAGLVFNQGLQVCDWRFNVSKPCGTLPATDLAMTIDEYVTV
ncbi:chondroitin proteoglycan 2-like [Pecten maximus]|uniref:chondroitin proteoglycan 2-like n=1 Tax=Pecten maximus TaxID=6579 RepID=UPI001457EED9|nr:chondroitin proteoglycan 2-like [Pecten maximus]